MKYKLLFSETEYLFVIINDILIIGIDKTVMYI